MKLQSNVYPSWLSLPRSNFLGCHAMSPPFRDCTKLFGKEFQSVGDAFIKALPFKVVLVRTAGVVVLNCYLMMAIWRRKQKLSIPQKCHRGKPLDCFKLNLKAKKREPALWRARNRHVFHSAFEHGLNLIQFTPFNQINRNTRTQRAPSVNVYKRP